MANKIHRRKITKTIRVGLDPDDREPFIKELTKALTDYEELKAEAANVAGEYRNKLKDVKDKYMEAALTLSQGIPEDRDVEEVKNFGKRTVTYVDVETRKVLERRAMTDEDEQMAVGEAVDDEDKDSEREIGDGSHADVEAHA